MSLDTPPGAEIPTQDDGEELLRQEGIETTTEVLPEPARHGANLHYVLNDLHLPESEIPHDYGDRDLGDGSLYQHARARWYQAQERGEIVSIEDSRGREREYVVLEDDYQHEGERVAVTLNSSRCELGTLTSAGNHRQWYKYNLTLQPVDDDGEIRWGSSPNTALNVVLRPQYPNLAKASNGEITENWSPPFGTGTEVIVQTTWADSADEIEERSISLVDDVLGYTVDELDIQNDSRRFWKAECHHRVMEEVADEIVHVIRQSSELLARHEADIEERSIHSDGKWQIIQLTTDGWDQLGFPILYGQEIEIKLYLPDAPAEYLEYPMDQPKIEVSLRGRPSSGQAYHADRWGQIYGVLEEILLSHMKWADVGTEHVLQDEMSEGPHADLLRWEHPEGRRAWLRNHYESLIPRLYAEARKADTVAVYDILHSVKRRGTATYEQIADDVGLHQGTVRGHVARLCGDGGEPGILKRIQDSCTFVTFSARFWEDDAHEALDQTYPNDTAEDRKERREGRVEARFLKRTLGMTPAQSDRHEDWTDEELDAILEAAERAGGRERDDDLDGDRDDRGEDVEESEDSFRSSSSDQSESWDPFGDLPLTAQDLAVALETETVQEDHVQVRTDPYPTLGD